MFGGVAFDCIDCKEIRWVWEKEEKHGPIFWCAPWLVSSALLQRCNSPPSACDRCLSDRRTDGWTQDPRPAVHTLWGGQKEVRNVCCCCPYIAEPELSGCTISTINTCHFGKNTLFYDGRQHLPVYVLKFLVAMAVTEGLHCREPWETFEVGSRVLKTHQYSFVLETQRHTGSDVDTTRFLPTPTGFHASSWCLIIGFNNLGRQREM